MPLLGDQVLLLDDHCKLQAGSPLEVYQRPVGFIAADLMSDPGVNAFVYAGYFGRCSAHAAVRPEHVHLSAEALGSEFSSFDMQVQGQRPVVTKRSFTAWLMAIDG